LGADRDEMTRELADEIAARNPHRQREPVSPGDGVVDRATYQEQMRMNVERRDAIARRGTHGESARRAVGGREVDCTRAACNAGNYTVPRTAGVSRVTARGSSAGRSARFC